MTKYITFRDSSDRVFEVTEGDFLQYTFVTDTDVVEVVKVSPKSIVVRHCQEGEVVKRENIDGNPYPIVYTEQVSGPDEVPAYGDPQFGMKSNTRRLILRKDGTFRMPGLRTTLTLARKMEVERDGETVLVPVRRVDYRM